MRRFLTFVIMLALTAVLASCGSDNDPRANLVTAVTTPSFAVVTDAGGATSIVSDVSCIVEFDDENKTALVMMPDPGWNREGEGSVLRFSGLDWVFSGLARRLTTKSAAPDGMPEPVLSDIRILYQAPREISGRMVDGLAVSFTTDGKRVTFIPLYIMLNGSTESVALDDPVEAIVSTKTVYEVEIDSSSLTASVVIRDPQFDLCRRISLPELELHSLKVELNSDGFTISSPSEVPYVGGFPDPDYEIRDLKFDVSLFGQSSLSYVTAAGYTVKAYFDAVYMP